MRAVICSKTGNIEEAYKTYEEILFFECNILNMVFNSLCSLSIKENNTELAESFCDKETSGYMEGIEEWENLIKG